ncbi:MAG: lantibiotic dehydratase, partial [Myxococcales bacterium]|nr:lantibiotic dehydratase [Myxococcales bacterium]
FRCALALASPSLASRVSGPMPARRNKRARHLETSLYRYLARAVGRTEPCGLWTGVTLAHLGDGERRRIDACEAATHFAPELAPARALLRALAAREPYRGRGPYRLNPTLQTGADGRWSYARRGPSGAITKHVLPDSPIWALLDAQLGRAIGDLAELGARLSGALEEAAVDALLEFSREAGLLVGGLDLPLQFTDAWDALAQAEASLVGDDQLAWREAVAALRSLCADLEASVDAALAGVDDAADQRILAATPAIAEILRALAAALDVPCPTLDGPLVRCDLAAPFAITLSADDRARCSALLQDFARFQERHGLGPSLRAIVNRDVRAGCDGSLAAAPVDAAVDAGVATAGTWEQLCAGLGDDPSLAARIARWDALLSASAGAASVTCPISQDHELPPGPPMGALVLHPGRPGVAPAVRGLSFSATPTHARHAYHLAGRGDPLTDWVSTTLTQLEQACGVSCVELAHPHVGSPNVLARPDYGCARVNPWGADAGALDCAGARLVDGPQPGAPLVELADGRRLAVHVFTATGVPRGDYVTERMLVSTFYTLAALPPADRLAFAFELSSRTASPRVTLPSGASIRAGRVILADHEARALCEARGARRYLVWQTLARRHGFAPLARITCGRAPSLLVPRDSALALEAAMEGVRGVDGEPPRIVVEEVVEDAWVSVEGGARHIAELVLPFVRARHLWQRPQAEGSVDRAA